MPTNWQRIEDLFHQASDLQAKNRKEFLRSACGDDEDVHREVLALLSAGDGGKDLPTSFIPERLRPGQRVDRFEILATCGRGSGGTVYAARDTDTGGQVAIKVFPQFLTPEQRRRYVKEVHAVSALNHPNVVGVGEAGRAGDRDFLVMEYVDGCNLGDAIPPGGMAVEEALELARMIVSGIAAAHAAGIVHRDLKPSNVMRTTRGSIKVVDFGLAKHIGTDGEGPLRPSQGTCDGQIVGTACYLSPEQARGEQVDARTDIFSFGAVLYEMLTALKPFDRGTLAGTLAAILRDTPVRMRELRPAIPVELSRLVRRCLEKDREKRFASADELMRALVRCHTRFRAPWRRVSRKLLRARVVIPAVAALFVLAAGASWQAVRSWRLRETRERIEPEIARLVGQHRYNAADVLIRRIESIVPGDQMVRDFARDYRVVTSVLVSVAGAEVAIKDYTAPDEPWRIIGRSPLRNITIPLGYLRWRVSAPGYRTRQFAETGVLQPNIRFAVYANGAETADMEIVPAGSTRKPGAVHVPEFSLDRFEVTNRQYQEFVDAGGYRRREFWQQEFVVNAKSVTWETAIATFCDQTGRAGPLAWELGRFPEGRGDFPVTGVSWYEAEAYARFAGKRLPVYAEWPRAARTEWIYADEILISNFSGKALAPVGSNGLGRFGTYDLLGNAKEWLWNEWGAGERLTMGGAWDEAYYAARVNDSAPPSERRANIGFRCARSTTPLTSLLNPVSVAPVRDYLRETPVDDRKFASIRQLYGYARTPLNAKLEATDESNFYWRTQKITFDAGYAGERVTAFLFLPRGAKPPYQTVIYAASGIAYLEKSSEHLEMWFIDPLIRSGRAVLYPVQWEMYERKPRKEIPPAERAFLLATRSVQDVRRSIDYLETRQDIATGELAYFGFSAGASLAPLVLGTEPRLKTAILAVGGLDPSTPPIEIDPFQFLSRCRLPVLLMNGRYDLSTPADASLRAFFNLLGTPAKDKKLVLVDAGHAMVGFPVTTRESLTWLDRYLGPVPMPVLKPE